jgi:fatty acid synthase subunit alpha
LIPGTLITIPNARIATQDAILGDFATERLIEIGPAGTLVNMATKTLNAGYKSQDIALGLRRELLSYKKDADAIYYDTPGQEAAAAASPSPTTTTTPPAPVTAQAPATLSPAAVTAAPATVSVPDIAVSPHDIITTLVSVALAKQLKDVAQDQTLKALCGGE